MSIAKEENMILTIILSTCFYTLATLYLLERRLAPQRARKFSEDMLIFKLESVKSYYPALRGLSYSEIIEKYDLDLAYEQITYHSKRRR